MVWPHCREHAEKKDFEGELSIDASGGHRGGGGPVHGRVDGVSIHLKATPGAWREWTWVGVGEDAKTVDLATSRAPLLSGRVVRRENEFHLEGKLKWSDCSTFSMELSHDLPGD